MRTNYGQRFRDLPWSAFLFCNNYEMDRQQNRAEIAVVAFFAACGVALIARGIFGLTDVEPLDARAALAVAGAGLCVFAVRFPAQGRERSASLFSPGAARVLGALIGTAAGFSLLRLLIGLDLTTSLVVTAAVICLRVLCIYFTGRAERAQGRSTSSLAPPPPAP